MPDTLAENLRIFRTDDGAALAAALFRECFGADFPVPRADAGLGIPTPVANWRQYVATWTWPEGPETVGFCNWIKYRDVYLEGGMCVRESFYRRLPREAFRALRERGGLAQMVMAHAATELTDCKAWFGFCGDAKAMAVDLRFGYVKTGHPHLIVKWFADVPPAEQEALIDAIAAIGPF